MRFRNLLITGISIVIAVIGIYYAISIYASQISVADRIKGVDTYGCGSVADISTFVDATGFVDIAKVYRGKLPFYDFVLRPGDVGQIIMDYKFSSQNICNNGSCKRQNSTQDILTYDDFTTFEKYFGRKIDIQKVNQTFPLTYYNSSDIQLNHQAVNLTDSVVRITYDIRLDDTAQKGPYLLDFINTCPGILLTVGDRPYQGSLPWDEGRIS